MIDKCSSAHRCSQIDCHRCARRYARRIARDFRGPDTGQVHAIAFAAGIADLDEFRQWRISAWNILTYRRQVCRWWQSVSLRLWFCQGTVRGVVALGSITTTEFETAFGSRWPFTLRRIDPEALFDELYAVVRPGSIMQDDSDHARYQPRQMTVRPRHARTGRKRSAPTRHPDPIDEPMPILIV